MVLWGRVGEKAKLGRWLRAVERNMFRGVVAEPERLATLRLLSEKLVRVLLLVLLLPALILLGLSPGILVRVRVMLGLLDVVAEKLVLLGAPDSRAKSVAVIDCESLLDGPWGRSIIFLVDNWASEARFAGLSGDALKPTRGIGGVSPGSTVR